MHNATDQTNSQSTSPPDQIPYAHSVPILEREPGAVQTRGPTPSTIPGSPQVPNHQLAPLDLEHTPLELEPPSPVAADTSDVQESQERLVERVREVVPDVLPAHVFQLLSIYETAFADDLLDVIVHILLEDQSYPKDLKGKARAREEEDEETTLGFSGDADMNVDYLPLNANRHLGSVYRTLSLVCFDSLASAHC